ncbi:hypothetical protein [Streptomyces albidoflavus]|uniref:hypothetical protein n=1 Tax=Streptomyces albidoflavus TaxID=1886 RepID=UPI00188CE21A|nr:hypothetical protein [Streptomyces albidoflavus]MBF4135478.1 hypothetical protein [Streptomyces albidoflavus]
MRPLTRLAATCATTAALLLTGAATASAATASTPAAPDHTPLTSLYRGVQGANLCLLAHCATGTNDPARVTNTQGANVCLLAVCSIRP